jgi:hypothetical protein
MVTRFMTDPDQMRAMAGRFDVHAQTVRTSPHDVGVLAEHRRCRLERDRTGHLLGHHGPDESGVSQHRDHAARGARRADRDANNYKQQEQASQQILSS